MAEPSHENSVSLQNYDDQEHFETSFVVKLHNFAALAEPQLLFSFSHPAPSLPPDNTRFKTLRFERKSHPSQLCHGLGGYFDCVLYKDMTLSTLPSTHTPGMFSWFPIFFPCRTLCTALQQLLWKHPCGDAQGLTRSGMSGCSADRLPRISTIPLAGHPMWGCSGLNQSNCSGLCIDIFEESPCEAS